MYPDALGVNLLGERLGKPPHAELRCRVRRGKRLSAVTGW